MSYVCGQECLFYQKFFFISYVSKSLVRFAQSNQPQSFSFWCLMNLIDKLDRLLEAALEKQFYCKFLRGQLCIYVFEFCISDLVPAYIAKSFDVLGGLLFEQNRSQAFWRHEGVRCACIQVYEAISI